MRFKRFFYSGKMEKRVEKVTKWVMILPLSVTPAGPCVCLIIFVFLNLPRVLFLFLSDSDRPHLLNPHKLTRSRDKKEKIRKKKNPHHPHRFFPEFESGRGAKSFVPSKEIGSPTHSALPHFFQFGITSPPTVLVSRAMFCDMGASAKDPPPKANIHAYWYFTN